MSALDAVVALMGFFLGLVLVSIGIYFGLTGDFGRGIIIFAFGAFSMVAGLNLFGKNRP